MNWDKIKKDPDVLLDLLQEYESQRALARELDIDHKSIKYWMDKYEITTNDYLNFEDSKEGSKEQKPDFVDKGSYYEIYAPGGVLEITKDELREFKSMYCKSDYLTLNQCGMELDRTRDEIYAIKTAFGITHDDVEFIDEDLKEKSVDELVDISLQRKKKQLSKKIREKEYKQALKENRKYRKEDFLLEKTIDTISEKFMDYENDFVPSLINYHPSNRNNKTMVVNMSDWHKGKFVSDKDIWGATGFNKDKYYKYIEKLISRTVELIDRDNPESLYVLNYGDGMDNPVGDQYENQIKHQDVKYEEQFVEFVSDVKNFLEEINNYFPKIKYSFVPGNHSKGPINWDLMCGMMISNAFKDVGSIEVDDRINNIKLHNIYDYNLIQMHGQNTPRNIHSNSAKVKNLNLLRMKNLQESKSYIVQGHYHHQAQEGVGYKKMLLPSFVGGDMLSNEMIKVSSRPAQRIFFFTEKEGLTDECNVYFD